MKLTTAPIAVSERKARVRALFESNAGTHDVWSDRNLFYYLESWRKPGSAMLTTLAARLNLDLVLSWLLGDRPSDLEAERATGVGEAVHVSAGGGSAENDTMRPDVGVDFRVRTVTVLADAASVLSEAGLIDARAR